MEHRKKNKKDLGVELTEMPSVDELMAREASAALSYTSPSAGKTIELTVFRYSGEDILNKTNVHAKNKRVQKYLTAKSLARLIKSLQKSNQVAPALGRIEDDGTVTVIYGSRRRMGCYFGETEYVILASKDLTDDIAEEISDAENISESISLIERGYTWLAINQEERLSSRDISEQFEASKVSHTIIAAGITGAKLPDDLIMLYPSINSIGRTTISKLSSACKHKKTEDILAYVEDELAEITTNLWDAFADDNGKVVAELSGKLSDAISAFSRPRVPKSTNNLPKTNKQLTEGVNAKVDSKGRLEYITFDEGISKEKLTKLQNFLIGL
jgi:ParB family chromosome partitioning protein